MRKTFTASVVLLAAWSASASVPAEINFQGRLTDSGGTPVTGAVNMEFELFYSEFATSPPVVWIEQQTIEVTDGIFSVRLGSVTPLDPMRFMSGEMWLEVRVEGEALLPRYKLVSAPFALVTDPDTHRHHYLQATDGNPLFAVSTDADGNVQTAADVTVNGSLQAANEVQAAGNVQTDAGFTYSAARTFYLSMPFSAFKEATPALNTRWYLMDDYAYPNAGPAPHIVNIYAPVYLPQGATVTEVSVYYFDNRDPENLTVSFELYRMPFAAGSATSLATASTTTSGIVFKTDLTQTTIANAVIDNQTYWYQLKVIFNSGDYANMSMGFVGARIAYTLTSLKP